MARWFSGLLIWIILVVPAFAETQKGTARIGVLAYRGSERLEQKWFGLKNYLDGTVAGWKFDIVPVTLSSAKTKIEAGDLDFIVTNPGHFSELNQNYFMSIIASRQQQKSDGTYSSAFGSAIVTRKGSGILLLQDVTGKSVAAVDRNAFGGFQLAWREFQEVGVDLFADDIRLNFVGFPMDQVISMVLDGRADVGIVRSGLVEDLAAEHLINPDDLEFLNATANYTHPDMTSTRLYPEWPFAAFNTTDPDLRDRVAVALLTARSNLFAQESGMVDLWTAPVPNRSVEELVLAYRNRINIMNTPKPESYQLTILVLLGLSVFGGGIAILLRKKFPLRTASLALAIMETETDLAIAQSSKDSAVQMTRREQEIFDLIAQGLPSKEIARKLSISPKAVEFHRANLLKKFGARTSSQMVAMAT